MHRLCPRYFTILNNLLRKHEPIYVDCNYWRQILVNFSTGSKYSVDKQKIQSPLTNLIAKDGTTTTTTTTTTATIDTSTQDNEDDETRKQRESSWKTMKYTLAFFGFTFSCLGGYLIITLGAPAKDEDGNIIYDELSDLSISKQYLIRTYRELDNYRRLIREPSRDKLLPDPLKYPYFQPKYTLVLELTDVLVHPDWTYNTGWRFKKRPGLDYFLETLHGSYEIVIYTAEQGMTVFPLMEALDPKNLIAYKLVRDATHFVGGTHVKSLDKLNRDLSKVVVVDWNPNNVQFQPFNLFKIKRWNGKDDDLTLIDLANFLKTISENDIDDVRDVLKYYSEYDDPIEAFKEKQKKVMEYLEAQNEAKKFQDPSKVRTWLPTFFNKKNF